MLVDSRFGFDAPGQTEGQLFPQPVVLFHLPCLSFEANREVVVEWEWDCDQTSNMR